MNKEELAYNDYYERTKDYGRSQFVKLIVATEEEKRLLNNRITKLQQENNQLKEQRQELRSWLENKDNCGYEKIYLKDILIMLKELEGNNE